MANLTRGKQISQRFHIKNGCGSNPCYTVVRMNIADEWMFIHQNYGIVGFDLDLGGAVSLISGSTIIVVEVITVIQNSSGSNLMDAVIPS